MVNSQCRTRRARSQERGTAIFVVVLVVTLLTGIGIFAARITGSVDAATGYARQAAQVRALAIYGAQLAPAILANAAHKQLIPIEMDAALANANAGMCPSNGLNPATNTFRGNMPCAIRGHEQLGAILSVPILTPQLEETSGSLGPQTAKLTNGIDGNLRLEFFSRERDLSLSGFEAGSNTPAGGEVPFEYTITASAQIRPIVGAANTGWCSPDNQSSSANVQAIRVYVTALANL